MTKINPEEAMSILKDFKESVLSNLDWYINIKTYVKAELLYGSVAKGTNKPESDIDMLIILPLEIEEKFTTGEYFYNYKGYEINIVLRSIERLRDISSGPHNAFQAEVFNKSIIISESDNEVAKLVDIIQEN